MGDSQPILSLAEWVNFRGYIFTNPTARAGYDTRSIFKWSLIGLNSEFSFSWTSFLTKAEETSLPYYLPIAGGRIIGFIPFPRVLVRCEMQSVSSRIWTRVTVSISYDDNHYTTGTFCYITVFQRIQSAYSKPHDSTNTSFLAFLVVLVLSSAFICYSFSYQIFLYFFLSFVRFLTPNLFSFIF